MSMLIVAASVLPLVPIAADDDRLDHRRTFVSELAQVALEQDDGERVLCLDRTTVRRVPHICLTEGEWNKAIELAENEPRRGPRPFIPQREYNYSSQNSFSQASVRSLGY